MITSFVTGHKYKMVITDMSEITALNNLTINTKNIKFTCGSNYFFRRKTATNCTIAIQPSLQQFTIILQSPFLGGSYSPSVATPLTIEFEFESFNTTPQDELLEYLYQNTDELFGMYIDLYVFYGEIESVDKTSKLTAKGFLIGTFKEETSVLEPNILIGYETLPNFNYVKIDELDNRYYFVRSISSVRNKLWKIELHVDVLFTYCTDIKTQSGFVDRYESGSTLLHDVRFPLSDKLSYSYMDVQTLYPSSNNSKNIDFDITPPPTTDAYWWYKTTRWVVCGRMKSSYFQQYKDLKARTNSGFKDIYSFLPSLDNGSINIGTNYIIYCLDSWRAAYFTNAIMKKQSLATYISSFVFYPFNIMDLLVYPDDQHLNSLVYFNNQILNDTNDGEFIDEDASVSTHEVNARAVLDIPTFPPLIIADFTIPSASTFRDIEPCSNYELWLPFVGWVQFKSVDILGKRIQVYYAIDIESGFANVFVRDYSSGTIVYSSPCQVGIKLPITTTNADELTKQKQNNNTNLALGLIGAGVSTGVGMSSGSPLGIIGGVLSGSKAIASFVNANNLMFSRAQTSSYSGETSLFSYSTRVILRVTYHDNLSDVNTSVYAKTQGLPFKGYCSLSTLTGYVEIPNLHYVPSSGSTITITEIEEITSLLKSGVIL